MYNLARWKQWQAFFGTLSLFYGVAFFIAGHIGIQAMEPQTYGEVAVDGSIEAWATVQLSGAFMLCMGIIMNGRWRWSCVPRGLGASVVVGLALVLSASAFSAPSGWPIGLFCLGFALWGAPVIWWNLVDAVGAVRWWRDKNG